MQHYYFAFILSVAFFSCTTVKNFPAGRPFVYETNVELVGEFKADDKKQLQTQLAEQLHDSMQVRDVRKLIGLKGIMYREIVDPPVYDTANADKSAGFMSALLHSLGYTRDSISYTATIDTVETNRYQTTIDFFVYPGKLITIDSISYNLAGDSVIASERSRRELDTLQHITTQNLEQTFVKKGDPFSTFRISSERNRLADVYRNNGYLKYSAEEMLVLWDTVGIALLRPTLDPLEQARQLEELARRRQNPKADIEFRLRPSTDSTRITRYYIGNVTVYPDLTVDTASYERKTAFADGYKFVSYQDLFKVNKLTDFISLKRGDLYRQSNYLKTQNRFNSLGAWRLVTIGQFPRDGQDTVDFEVRLTPAKKYHFTANLEGSRNQGNVSLPQGNLIGIGITLGIQNRNFAKAANRSNTNFRYGVELDATKDPIQTEQFSLSHTILFPRVVPKMRWFFNPQKDNEARTIFAMNLALTNRKEYYDLTTVSTSWGYEKSWGNKLLGVRFPNFEYNLLDRGDSLDVLINRNKSFKYIFNTGLIVSSIINLTVAGGKQANVARVASGSLEVPLILNKMSSELYRFVKLDAEYRQTHKIRRSAFAWRVFSGIGVGLPFDHLDSTNKFLPFFRSYYAGGPNSMRAWSVRRLGPGSSIKSFARTDAPDRFGDLRLEANAEYRFYVTEIPGMIVNGAFFTDIGNVWFLRENKDFLNGEFKLNKLAKDIAIGVGTGLRLDFGGFLKVRFDYAFKAKNPTPDNAADQNRWFHDWKWNNGQFQLGIDYPF